MCLRLCLFRKFGLNHSIHSYFYGGTENSDFIKKIFICVPKMNESLMGLERHEGE